MSYERVLYLDIQTNQLIFLQNTILNVNLEIIAYIYNSNDTQNTC